MMATKGKNGKEGADAPIRTLADTHLWKQFAKLREKHAGEKREDVTLVIANKLTLNVEDAWYIWRALDLDPQLDDPDLDDPNLRDLLHRSAKSWVINVLDPKAHLSKDGGKVTLSLPHSIKIPPDLVKKIKALRTTGARHFSWRQDAKDLDALTRFHFLWLDNGAAAPGGLSHIAEITHKKVSTLETYRKDYRAEWTRTYGKNGKPRLKEAIDAFPFREWHERNMREWQEQNLRRGRGGGKNEAKTPPLLA